MSERVEQVQKTWDTVSKDFDKHMEETGHYVAQDWLVDELGFEFKPPVLDVGAGPGYLVDKLSNQLGLKITANDLSANTVKQLSEHFKSHPLVRISEQDAKVLGSDQKFGTILSCNTFYYFKDEERDAVIQNWKSLLDKDGSIIFLEEWPFIISMDHKDRERILKLVHPIPPEEIERVLVRNGFRLKTREAVAIDDQHKLYGSVFKRADEY